MFYFDEVNNLNDYRKCEQLKAKNLTNAKRESTRRQFFQNTIIKIYTDIDDQGFGKNCLAFKNHNGKWKNIGGY